jgi:DNA-binding transcriptional ArsR family regulator
MSAPRRDADLDAAFAALADPTRRAVIRTLLKGPRSAGELAHDIAISPPALSRHLRTLRRCGLLTEHGIEADARVRVYQVQPSAFAPMRDWIAQVEAFWRDQLGAFKAHAEKTVARRRDGRR